MQKISFGEFVFKIAASFIAFPALKISLINFFKFAFQLPPSRCRQLDFSVLKFCPNHCNLHLS